MKGSPDNGSDASAEGLRARFFARSRLLIGAWYGTSAVLVALLAWRVTADADGRSDWLWAGGCSVAGATLMFALFAAGIVRQPHRRPPRGDEAARERKRGDNAAILGAVTGTSGLAAVMSQLAPTTGWLGFFLGAIVGSGLGIALIRRYLYTHPQMLVDQQRRGYRI
jgi:hypothetical protein